MYTIFIRISVISSLKYTLSYKTSRLCSCSPYCRIRISFGNHPVSIQASEEKNTLWPKISKLLLYSVTSLAEFFCFLDDSEYLNIIWASAAREKKKYTIFHVILSSKSTLAYKISKSPRLPIFLSFFFFAFPKQYHSWILYERAQRAKKKIIYTIFQRISVTL